MAAISGHFRPVTRCTPVVSEGTVAAGKGHPRLSDADGTRTMCIDDLSAAWLNYS